MSMNKDTTEVRPVLLVIMDGWGMGSGDSGDAIAQAQTPNFDRLWNDAAHTTLLTHGPYVGLSSGKDLGGSEVGHSTMGAGKILDQGPTRINHSIQDGSFFASEALQQLISRGKQGGTLHLVGLLSDGNIHAHIEHFKALIQHADRQGVAELRIHALLDGRDVGVQTADAYVQQIETVFASINQQTERNYTFASAGGRETTTMDRDHQWDRVQIGWEAHVHGQSSRQFCSMQQAIRTLRAENPGIIDQDLPAFVLVDAEGKPLGAMQDGDAVAMMNFRADRAIELCEAFCLDDFDGFERGFRPDVCFAGMMVYDEDRDLPQLQLMGPTSSSESLGRLLVEAGIRQFRLSESQKYPHVTFFFNGGYREPLDAELEDYILIPSDKNISFADYPVMKSVEITDQAIKLIECGDYGFGLINYPNADMVGHCGKLEPTVAAIEAVDVALGRLIDAVEAAGWSAVITADHGNGEEMQIADKDGKNEASTRHSLNPVPCVVFDPPRHQHYKLRQPDASLSVQDMPGLSHLAATILQLMALPAQEGFSSSLICDQEK